MWQEQCLRYKDEDIQGCLLKSQRHRLHFGSRASFLMTFLIDLPMQKILAGQVFPTKHTSTH